MPQPVQGDLFSPTVEKKPCNGRDAPPREVAEDDLQVYQQLTDLHIQISDVKAQHEVEVVRKEAYDDACKVEVRPPKKCPADNDPQMPLQKGKIAFDRSLDRLICPLCQPFENTKRERIIVVLGVRLAVHCPHDDDEQQHTRQRNDKNFCSNPHNAPYRRPISCEVLAADEQGEKLARRVGKARKIGRQQDIPLHDGGVFRDRRSERVFRPEQLTEIIRDGQTQIAARLAETQIGLPKHRSERKKG